MGARTGKHPDLIIFDLDGTIIDTEPTSIQAWIQAGREFDLEISQDHILPYIGRNAASIQDLAEEQFGNDVRFEEIFQRKKEICRLEFAKGITLKKGVRELISALKEMGIPSCIATSSGKIRSERFLRSHDLLKEFEFLISGEEVTHSKPHPEIFLRCMERAGVLPEQTMVVEDSSNGIIGARKSGATSVLIPDVVPADDIMRAHADLQFGDLLELKAYLLDPARKA